MHQQLRKIQHSVRSTVFWKRNIRFVSCECDTKHWLALWFLFLFRWCLLSFLSLSLPFLSFAYYSERENGFTLNLKLQLLHWIECQQATFECDQSWVVLNQTQFWLYKKKRKKRFQQPSNVNRFKCFNIFLSLFMHAGRVKRNGHPKQTDRR